MKNDELDAWMDRLVGYVRSGWPDLTNRQLALVLLVYETDGPHTVRGIAEHLRITKPVISRALDSLGAYGFLQREPDCSDRRGIFIRPTARGREFLRALTG